MTRTLGIALIAAGISTCYLIMVPRCSKHPWRLIQSGIILIAAGMVCLALDKIGV